MFEQRHLRLITSVFLNMKIIITVTYECRLLGEQLPNMCGLDHDYVERKQINVIKTKEMNQRGRNGGRERGNRKGMEEEEVN